MLLNDVDSNLSSYCMMGMENSHKNDFFNKARSYHGKFRHPDLNPYFSLLSWKNNCALLHNCALLPDCLFFTFFFFQLKKMYFILKPIVNTHGNFTNVL